MLAILLLFLLGVVCFAAIPYLADRSPGQPVAKLPGRQGRCAPSR
jgi:hypothetical protein